MVIRKDGIMVQCPECESTNIMVIEIIEHWIYIRN
jgi:transposase-like protein